MLMSEGRLPPSPSLAAIASVRLPPPPPTMTGIRDSGRGQQVVSDSQTRSLRYCVVPGCRRARSVSMADSSSSNLAWADGNGRPEPCVLARPPAGPDAAERSSAAQYVKRGHSLGQDPGRAERHGFHQRAQQANTATCHQRNRVRRSRLSSTAVQVASGVAAHLGLSLKSGVSAWP